MDTSTIVLVYIRAVLFWLALAFVVFAYFWIKYGDGMHRRTGGRETIERMAARARSTPRHAEEPTEGY
jgi:hypothetical protein